MVIIHTIGFQGMFLTPEVADDPGVSLHNYTKSIQFREWYPSIVFIIVLVDFIMIKLFYVTAVIDWDHHHSLRE